MFVKLSKLILIVSISIASMLHSEAIAKVFTFNPSDFIVTNNGTLTTAGYDTTYNFAPPVGWVYRLTDSVGYQGTIIWHTEMLDLNQEFVLNYRLRFGTGKANGMAVIFTTDKSGALYSPHLDLSTSEIFIVEYDPLYDGDNYEGSDGTYRYEHTAFLGYEGYFALPNTYAPMQDNYASVCVNQWICCKIIYKRHGSGWRIESWIENLDPLNNRMVLRSSRNIASPSGLVSDVTTNSNGESLVHFGWAAATCERSDHDFNRHEIMFLGAKNENFSTIDSTDFIHIIWEGVKLKYYAYNSTSVSPVCGSMALNIYSTSFPDTIRVDTVFCINKHSNNVIIFLNSTYNNIAWAIKDTTTNPPSYQFIPTDSTTRILFPIHSYGDSTRYNPADMWVRLILDGKDIYFNFKFSDNTQEANK